MSPTQIVVLILIVLVLVVAALVARQFVRRRSLQKTFGPEYDRVVAEQDSRAAGEKELRDRERRHAELELTPLTPENRARYTAAWEEVQIRFVDAPDEAVGTADELVTRLIAERGYPTGSYDDQLATLSVQHAQTLGHYRDAHQISQSSERGEATTEDLRQALVHYRALFADLLGLDPVPSTARPETDPTDNPAANADRSETARSDTALPEAGRHAATHPDAATPDTATPDTATPDTASPDTASRDIPSQDTARHDNVRHETNADGARPDAQSR
jgi:hypothetical protein